jgi:hypothetical protein
VNRCFRCRLLARRTRSSGLGAVARLCVGTALRSGEFPLARSLPSRTSAVGFRSGVRHVLWYYEAIRFPCSSIIAVRSETSRCGLGVRQGEHRISRFPYGPAMHDSETDVVR